MNAILFQCKSTLAACALVLAFGIGAPASAEPGPDLDRLFTELGRPDNPVWDQTESDIIREWSKSGSPAMDLLLKRGQQAIEAGDLAAAIEHLTALTDHAPYFAEGWNARATAYFLAGQYGPSVADIERTLVLEPRHFGALSGLGMIFQELGMPDRALDALLAARAIHPHRPDITQAVERLQQELQGTDL